METGIKATLYKTDKEIFIYENIGSIAEDVMMSLGYTSTDYWFSKFEYEYCKKPSYRIKGRNLNDDV